MLPLAQIVIYKRKKTKGQQPQSPLQGSETTAVTMTTTTAIISTSTTVADKEVITAPGVVPSPMAASSTSDSAEMAENILQNYGYPQNIIDSISYCIRVHSYSKQLVPASLEGRILQDADSLDALGAIDIARTFSGSGSEKRAFYRADDPFCRSSREPDDSQWTLDHFQAKLLKLKDLMHTKTAKKIAQQRTRFMLLFIRQLQKEI